MSGAGHRAAFFLLLALIIGVSGGISACAKGLPDANSPAAQLYGRRCGGCHQVYPPKSMTAAMWRIQVAAMAPKMAAAGAPLSAADQQAILVYLQKHAGTE